ncbi:MAG: glycosyltransferase family 4 protein [Bacteroidales bacterium]|nr:glycosyltransferase family 4 protein [Bacteroidales bacterium]
MKSAAKNPSVLFVGDSRKMRGGVSAVIRQIEETPIWDRYSCDWLECQINDTLPKKFAYLLRALVRSLFIIPRYDIIHFHTAIGNSIKVQMPFFLYARLLKKKTIVHLHVGDQLREGVHDKWFHFICKHTDRVVTLGDSLRQYIPISAEGRPVVEFLYNPAPPVQPKEYADSFFLFAAFIDSEKNKGYDVLLKAFRLVSEHHPGWKLVICGDGDMSQLKSLIASLRLESVVETPGWVTGKEKEYYFRHAFAYCLTSRKEGLPVTVLESLSSGLPVIATPVGCLPEILRDGETALLAKVGDAEHLAGQMCRLIEDPALYDQLSKNGPILVEEKLSLARFTQKLDTLYHCLWTA